MGEEARSNIATENIDFAEAFYRSRRRRDEIFGDQLFSDPAWDILLDLYIARGRGRRVRSTNICTAARCPQSTALRWVELLADRDIIKRGHDEQDRRVRYVYLTDLGLDLVDQYFATVSHWKVAE